MRIFALWPRGALRATALWAALLSAYPVLFTSSSARAERIGADIGGFLQGRPSAFEDVCRTDPTAAKEALLDYLATHRGEPIAVPGTLFRTSRTLGQDSALAVAAHMFLADKGVEQPEWWLRHGARELAPPWSWYYRLKLQTQDDDERLRLVAQEAQGASPDSVAELDALYPRTPSAMLLRSEGYRLLAYDLQDRGKTELPAELQRKAMADAQAALRLAPASGPALVAIAAAEHGLEENASALQHLNEAIGHDPTCSDAFSWRSRVLKAMGRTHQAAADGSRAKELEAAVREARLRSRPGRSEESKAAGGCLRQAFVMLSSGARGDTYLTRAFEHLDNLVRYHAGETRFRLQRGLLHHVLGHWEQALVDYDAYAKAEPDVPYSQYVGAAILSRLRRTDEAARARRTYEEAAPRFQPPELPGEMPPPLAQEVGLDYFAVKRLGDDPTANAQTLARVLLDPGADGPTWCEAVKALGRLDADQLKPLAPMLEDATRVGAMDYPLRGMELDLLARAGEGSSLNALLYLAVHPRGLPSQHWANKAVKAIAKFPVEVATPALKKLLLSAPMPEVRSRARGELMALLRDDYGAFATDIILRAPRDYQVRVASPNTDALHLLVLLEILCDPEADQGIRQQASEVLRKSSCGYAAEWVEKKGRAQYSRSSP